MVFIFRHKRKILFLLPSAQEVAYLEGVFEQPFNLFDDVLWLVTIDQISSGVYAFFYIPPLWSGDDIMPFISLVNKQNNGLPVYGLQARGLDPQQDSYASIDEMIGLYMSSTCSKEHRGPYYLLGHSFGGLISLGVVHWLSAQGCVLKLAIMQTKKIFWSVQRPRTDRTVCPMRGVVA